MDLRFGVALACYFNSQSKEGARKYTAGEFYGHFIPAHEQNDDAMLAFMQAFTDAHNKRVTED